MSIMDDYLVAKTQTDAQGRFVFCRVNEPVRMVVDGKAGEEFIPGPRDMFFEIERKRRRPLRIRNTECWTRQRAPHTVDHRWRMSSARS